MNRRTFIQRLGILGAFALLPLHKEEYESPSLLKAWKKEFNVEGVYVEGVPANSFIPSAEGYLEIVIGGKKSYIYCYATTNRSKKNE